MIQVSFLNIHFIGGEKGGVGKSVVARLLAQYWIDREQLWKGYDGDLSHGALLRHYSDYADPLDIERLEDLDQLGFRTVVLGFLLLTVAIVAGAVWARQEWGVNWVWDPKAVWTTLSWLVYALYLFVRIRAGWRGERAAWLAASGFALSILIFLSTNYLLAAGRHVFQ